MGRFLDINLNVPSLEDLSMLPLSSRMTIAQAEEQLLDMRPARQGPDGACFAHLYACGRPEALGFVPPFTPTSQTSFLILTCATCERIRLPACFLSALRGRAQEKLSFLGW